MLIDQKRVDELTQSQPLKFEDALYLMRTGKRLTRQTWKGAINIILKKDMSVQAFEPYFQDIQGSEFRITTNDILAEDWMIV